MVLFRRSFDLSAPPRRATGWILGSSRYLLFANGQRIQLDRLTEPTPGWTRYRLPEGATTTVVLEHT
jgi:hypothetical protein